MLMWVPDCGSVLCFFLRSIQYCTRSHFKMHSTMNWDEVRNFVERMVGQDDDDDYDDDMSEDDQHNMYDNDESDDDNDNGDDDSDEDINLFVNEFIESNKNRGVEPYGEGDRVTITVDDDLAMKLLKVEVSLDRIKKVTCKCVSLSYLLGMDTSDNEVSTKVLTTRLGGGSDVIDCIRYYDDKMFNFPTNPFCVVTKIGTGNSKDDFYVDNCNSLTVQF